MESLPDISELPPSTLNACVAIGIGVGTLYCFLGYRTLRFVIGLTGFILAGGVAFVIAAWLSAGHTIASAAVGMAGGLCGAVALTFLYRAGVFKISVVHLPRRRPCRGIIAGQAHVAPLGLNRQRFWHVMDGFFQMPARLDPYEQEDRQKIEQRRRAGGRT